MDAVSRIEAMEARMLRLAAALDALETARADRDALEAYLQSPLWRQDYEADEAGAFPPELPRGVLSQDGLYDLLARWDRLCR